MKKILLDTDIGSDIDDCFALAYLLSHKDIEILGITTTTGLPEFRAQLADKVCSTYGKQIPIHVGYERSLSDELRQPTLTKAQTLVAESSEKKYSKNNTAIEFLRETIEKHPNEATLFCIGPMTNAAALFEKYPHTASILDGMVIMGGMYGDKANFDTEKWGITEWNILCDTVAADIVFKQNVKNCLVIGVEQTCRYHISPAPIKAALYENAKLRAVSDSVNTVAKQVWFHDVIAIYAYLYPHEVTLEKGNVTLQFANGDNPVATVFEPDVNGRHVVVTDFSVEKFKSNYQQIVGISADCMQ